MIHVKDLTYRYPGASQPSLRGISMDVRPGEIFGFLGPSGAGKSTIQNVMIGLLRDFEGLVEIDGQSIRTWGRDLYRRIGVCFELPNHYLKLTARENLEYFAALMEGDTETPEAVMEQVGLLEHLDKPVANYSKGMKNRLNLARSLLNRPRLWFLDEPTSGLDPVNAVRVRELIKARQQQGVTTVITTHNMSVADSLCDRVGFIVDGELRELDSPANLRRSYGVREVLVTSGNPDAPDTERFPMSDLAVNVRGRPMGTIEAAQWEPLSMAFTRPFGVSQWEPMFSR